MDRVAGRALATVGGTLVLAIATFASVRSGDRAPPGSPALRLHSLAG